MRFWLNSYQRRATVAAGLATLGAWFLVHQVRESNQVGEDRIQVWFYDESEKRLYPMPRETIPPDRGVGGIPGDGFRAVVIANRGEEKDPSKRRIAYLETYTPALRERVRAMQTSKSAKKFSGKRDLAWDSEFVQANTLVRRLSDGKWHSAASPTGRQILTEWSRKPDSSGRLPILCMPSAPSE